jgi:hypothetical protein
MLPGRPLDQTRSQSAQPKNRVPAIRRTERSNFSRGSPAGLNSAPVPSPKLQNHEQHAENRKQGRLSDHVARVSRSQAQS